MFCYFQISIAGSPPQTVVFQLHPDKCPNTCDNFVALCQSSATAKRRSSASSASARDVQPTYRGTDFHRILPGFMIQGGDFTKFDGTGGYAAPTTNQGQPTFPDENFDVSHDREGILSMANRGKNTNGSQFFVTLGKTLHLDGKHCAFGHVFRGMEVVREVSKVETEGGNGRPVMLQRVVIVDCGLGTGDDADDGSNSSDGSGSSSSSSYSRSNDRKKRSSRSKKRKRYRDDYDDDDACLNKKRERSRDRSKRHSKHRKKHDKDERKRSKHKDNTSHRHRSGDQSSHSSSGDERDHGRASKKRHKHDSHHHHRKKKSDRK